MKTITLILFFSCTTATAAPPAVAPGGLTPLQIIAHRQRSDESAAINPGSGQARFLFNSTVINSNSQSTNQPKFSSANNLSSAYIDYLDEGASANVNAVANPFASKVAKSHVQGMVFLNSAHVTHMRVAPDSAKKIINESAPRKSK